MSDSRFASTHTGIRILAGILFFLGTYFALFAWLGVFWLGSGVVALLGITMGPDVPLDVTLQAIGVGLQATSGYLVWGWWLAIALGWRQASVRFWILAAAHEAVWIGLCYADNHATNSIWYTLPVTVACLVAAAVVALTSCRRPPLTPVEPSGSAATQ